MLFSLLRAPFWFWYTIDTLIASNPTITVIAYLDNVTVFGDMWLGVWEKAIRCLEYLAHTGFMIDPRKYAFCIPRMVVLGVEIH